MAVTVDSTRRAKNIKWDASALTGGIVDLRCVAGDDVSTRPGIPNDGYAVVTFPADFHGSSEVTITDADGNVEEGTITV